MITVLVADSQKLFAEAFSIALSSYGQFSVLEDRPSSGTAAVEVALARRPNISVLDYWMPQMGGPAATTVIASRSPALKVVLLAWYYGARELRNALGAGASGFLPKSLRLKEITDGLVRVHEGRGPIYPPELDRLVSAKQRDEAEKVWGRLATITPREMEVLRLIGEGLGKAAIAQRLSIAPATVRTHIERIMQKLKARTQMEAVAIARHYELIQV